MPKDPSIKKVLVIGSGPIVIGQAAEFDYSGSQACRSLREEGVEVVLVNSNPATIMTDKETADRVYIEPMDLPHLRQIIQRERPDGLLPTLGGQTALNLAVALSEEGILDEFSVRVLGTSVDSIRKAEDRELFKIAMAEISVPTPESQIATTLAQAMEIAAGMGFPLVIRPAYTLGGTGGGIAYNQDEFRDIASVGLTASFKGQILIESCVEGWKEVEYEVLRDSQDNCITVCNMENIDAMGIHTGDSIVVAPSLTLSDLEYQMLRTASIRIIRALRICGGCNVQFALNPQRPDYYVIEVNPRVSRSSALASKATGYPIARVAAKVALGLALDEITNRVTQKAMASFEPALDYVVVKIPRWPFDKFIEADRHLGTQMKATGEVMAIDRSFEGAFLKALSSLEMRLTSFKTNHFKNASPEELMRELRTATDGRIFALFESIRRDEQIEVLARATNISSYFLERLTSLVKLETGLRGRSLEDISPEELFALKKAGFSDLLLASGIETTEDEVRRVRESFGIKPTYKAVDTCAAEFEASTPYFYSTYGDESESYDGSVGPGVERLESGDQEPDAGNRKRETKDRKNVIVLGSGPIRIGQGIEFDYCSVHCIVALKRLGYQAVMINNNPETVSTDFDVSDRLYFEPLTTESVLNIYEYENPLGVIVQFGGQTAINLALPLHSAEVKVLGTDVDSIDITEDRDRFDNFLGELGIPHPPGYAVRNLERVTEIADEVGYPVLVRPSYVLGGRAMEIVYSHHQMRNYLARNAYAARGQPLLIDKYITGKEAEVDLISDGEAVIIPGIMEHVERAGIHSGDSMAVYPPQTLTENQIKKIEEYSIRIARSLKVKGLINIQFVIENRPEGEGEVFVLEVNPRASRTVPFMSKITGIPMIMIATMAILGTKLESLGYTSGLAPISPYVAVKCPVFSFAKMERVDLGLGPEMKSTGEVMGIARDYPTALRKALTAAGLSLPVSGSIFFSVADRDKMESVELAKRLRGIGYGIYSTEGTAKFLRGFDIEAQVVKKIHEGRPNPLDLIISRDVDILINTISDDKLAELDGLMIRREAISHLIPVLTSLDTAYALLLSLTTALKTEPRAQEAETIVESLESARGLSSAISRLQTPVSLTELSEIPEMLPPPPVPKSELRSVS